ncbi:hypothetical protein NQ317_008074 [Molorchus minor]|uniref:FAM86 N-terminal domain-containing protein n=1 Tax=Molorchus minor TaxID=1323400 RepID=A0ABQ9JFD8_9CUCU|nr:hypothetical protein NQ317_008074 [Molorchus minor]
MESKTTAEKIYDVAKQFLCGVPIKDFDWNDIFKELFYDLQEDLFSKTINSDLVLKYPIQISYQKAFLKHLIESLEKQDSEVHDNLYSAYGRLVALPSNYEHYFKHYSIKKSGKVVSLRENVNLISDGTTGLRTWQASLALSEWALQKDTDLKNKVILELGSGIGLTGLTIAMECSPSCFYFSDCHPSVLKALCDNVKLNIKNVSPTYKSHDVDILDETIHDRCLYCNRNIQPKIFILNILWEQIDEIECRKLGKINTVIASDVVYDTELFPPLIGAIKALALYCDVEEFIFFLYGEKSRHYKAFCSANWTNRLV